MNIESDYEMVIVGGGPSGSAAAITIAAAGYRVLLVEESSDSQMRIGESLPPSVRPLLRDLGVLDRFIADKHLPCFGNCSLWGSDELRITDFIFDPNGAGWHLDRCRFDATLRKCALEAGASLIAGVTAAGFEWNDDQKWDVFLTDRMGSQAVQCDWIVDATGRRSALARKLGIARQRDDRLIAIYSSFRSNENQTEDKDSRTIIESTSDGWWYSALLPSRERLVAFLTDADLAETMDLLSHEGFVNRVCRNRHIGRIIQEYGYEVADAPRGVDAGSARLDSFSGDRWIAVGDAALSFDPLSSQGILTALYTGLRGGQAIMERIEGKTSGFDGYSERLESIYDVYHKSRLNYYEIESRWLDQPFWKRRRRT